jgi:ATP-dependent helicase HrpA
VLVIASALSVQDVRDRPLEAQQQADQAHAKFDDEKSEFSGYLKLWKWINEARGGAPSLPIGAVRKSRRMAGGAAPGAQAILPVGQRAAAPALLPAQAPASTHAQAQQPPVRAAAAPELHQHPPRARVARHPHPAAHRGDRAQVAHQHQPASYEQLHLSMLAGLLGNVGCKSDEATGTWARAASSSTAPRRAPEQEAGPLDRGAELVETTRLFGRGIAAIEPQWLEQMGGHLLKKQLLDPHWEKKAAEVVALERATLYGIVVYNNRRVNFGKVDPHAARDIFIREALVGGEWETAAVSGRQPEADRQGGRAGAQVPPPGRAGGRRADLRLLRPAGAAGCVQRRTALSAGTATRAKRQPELLKLTRDELMRHEAAGITTSAFPKTVRLGGVDCAASYLHEPGDARDGITVTVPLFVLNQVSEERCEWLVPGMLKDKIQALLKSLPQRPRSRFVPLPESATRLAELFTPERLARQPDRRAAQAGARRDLAGCEARRLQARHAQPAPVHELPRGGRAWPPAGPRPQPGRAQGRVGRQGAGGLPGAGGAQAGRAEWIRAKNGLSARR